MNGDARSIFSEKALTIEGLGAREETRDAYLALIGPNESAATRAAMLQMSGCALVIRGMWRELGIRHKALLAPYRIGMAVADVVQIAKDAGAWRTQGNPGVGDVFLVDNPEHVGTVIARDETSVQSIDGGQKDESGRQVVRRRERVVIERAWFGTDGINNGVRRNLIGYVDCEALASAWGIG